MYGSNLYRFCQMSLLKGAPIYFPKTKCESPVSLTFGQDSACHFLLFLIFSNLIGEKLVPRGGFNLHFYYE